ncbi:MAG: L,D-transpeptidase family protein [Bacteroidia bacterium]|nr:L,D-transpeptidase family protein [Bacteroidia bacterium]
MFLNNVIHTCLLVFFTVSVSSAQVKTLAFKAGQLKNTRVKDAYDTKWPQLQEDLKAIKVNPETFSIYMRAFKYERIVEVWLKDPSETKYKLFRTYDICASSGNLGPKRAEGDGQVPEGFYRIDAFNAKSDYYLSMKINYPNTSDIILKEGISAGSNIMMHGNCVTIGCLPMTDDKIKELYVLCLESRNRNNPVYIDIFPIKFTNENIKLLETNYPKSKLNFWKSLKPAYDFFEEHRWLHKVNIDSKGHYFYEE